MLTILIFSAGTILQLPEEFVGDITRLATHGADAGRCIELGFTHASIKVEVRIANQINPFNRERVHVINCITDLDLPRFIVLCLSLLDYHGFPKNVNHWSWHASHFIGLNKRIYRNVNAIDLLIAQLYKQVNIHFSLAEPPILQTAPLVRLQELQRVSLLIQTARLERETASGLLQVLSLARIFPLLDELFHGLQWTLLLHPESRPLVEIIVWAFPACVGRGNMW